ncbi:hypothetical protein Tco_1443849, partial [Tanacetum coccineum]
TMLVTDAFFYLQTQLGILMGSDDRLLYAFITPGTDGLWKDTVARVSTVRFINAAIDNGISAARIC